MYVDDMQLGFTLTFEEATELYWQMPAQYTYRIVEKR